MNPTPALARLGSPKAVPRLKSLGGQALTAGFTVDVRLRTFVGVLYAMAFDGLVADSLPADFKASLPPDQVDAILRIESSPSLTEPEAAKLEYAGKQYAVSDAPGSMRYGMAFGGLQFVFAQTEPQPQIIQAR